VEVSENGTWIFPGSAGKRKKKVFKSLPLSPETSQRSYPDEDPKGPGVKARDVRPQISLCSEIHSGGARVRLDETVLGGSELLDAL
jgi:hypothetical protein